MVQEESASENPKAKESIARLRSSQFYDELLKDHGFESTGLSSEKIALGVDLLSNIYLNYEEAGVEQFINWLSHPKSGFLPQTSRAKKFPEDIRPAIEEVVGNYQQYSKEHQAEVRSNNELIRDSMVWNNPHETTIAKLTGAPRFMPHCIMPGSKVIREIDLTVAASNLLEHYLYPERFEHRSKFSRNGSSNGQAR